uniref:Zinc finger protein ZFMSA12A-like n=1 Tax=Sphaeramia orbicularis TaxID=375764 RepID=A0A672Y819_9TELE
MLEAFISMVTDAVPQLLTGRQRTLLLLALRAKVTLCDDGPRVDHAPHNEMWTVSEAADVFDQRFEAALQCLLSELLSRIEHMFPVPDFKQAASWLDSASAGLEACLKEADRDDLKELLTNQSKAPGQAPPLTTTVVSGSEKVLMSVWSHPLLTKPTNREAPPPSDLELQSDPVANAEPVKEVVTTQHQAAIGPSGSPEDGDVGGVQPSDSPGHSTVQSEETVDQSDQPCSDVTANALYSISHNSRRVAHKCPQCGKCFIYRSQVIRHLRTNKSCGSASTPAARQSSEEEPRPPARPFRVHSCFQCDAEFRTKAELLSHQRAHRSKPTYRCAQCPRLFHHLSSLTNHKRTHLAPGGFACARCDRAFRSAAERDAHGLRHRGPDLGCTLCGRTFTSQTPLLRHLQTHSVEGAEPRYSCRFCEHTFSGVTQLRIHQRSHTLRSFQCDLCSKSYGSLSGLHSHRQSHSHHSRFLCPQCGKRFKTRDGLEGHLRTHSGERPYRCPYCPKDFTALAGLNVHVRRHTGERPYVCAVCGKGWPSGGDLQKHMRTHTGERPYACQDCGKAFSISCHLTEHRRIHTGEKPFSCPECGKCLRRKFDLNKHLLSHRDVRPHACTHCPKSYTRRTHLTRHLRTHQNPPDPAPEDPPEPT